MQAVIDSKFQFLYGSIGSFNFLSLIICGTPFQFLYGSIGSGKIKFVAVVTVISIPIWFDWKINPALCHNSAIQFQFLYGSIGSLEVYGEFPAPHLFQFLYGSIGSYPLTSPIKGLKEFQFLYGSIGSEGCPSSSESLFNFNSYMVRL